MTELTVQQQKSQTYRQTNDYILYRWSGKFQCKKSSYSSYFNEIKTHEIFYYENFTFQIISIMHLPFIAHTRAC